MGMCSLQNIRYKNKMGIGEGEKVVYCAKIVAEKEHAAMRNASHNIIHCSMKKKLKNQMNKQQCCQEIKRKCFADNSSNH